MKRWFWIPLLVLLAGWMWLRQRPPRVEVVRLRQQEVAEVLSLSGRIRGREESRLAPEVQGTVQAILVREGQPARRGAPLFRLDEVRLQAQLEQAQERVRVAEAQLEVARRGPLPSQLEEVRAQVTSQQQSARAQLEAARQRLLEAQRGPRPETVAQARANLREARAEWDQRQREALRLQGLFREDAVSRQSLEQAETQAQRAQENWQALSQRLAELERGTRVEQLEQARQGVVSAEADLSQAREAGAARLQQLLDLPRVEDIQLAEAQLQEAQAARKLAHEQLALATVRAPYDGVVGRRLLRVGDATGPGQPVLTFSSQPALEIRIDVDESDRGQLRTGLRARVRAQGFGDDFEARLTRLGAEVDSVRGTLEAYLDPVKAPSWAVPGQSVDVNLILADKAPRALIPLTCVVQRGERAEVMVVEKGRTRFREVELSSPTQQGYLLRRGLDSKDLVVLSPQGLVEGQKVRSDEI